MSAAIIIIVFFWKISCFHNPKIYNVSQQFCIIIIIIIIIIIEFPALLSVSYNLSPGFHPRPRVRVGRGLYAFFVFMYFYCLFWVLLFRSHW